MAKPMTLSQLISAFQIHHTKAPFVYRLMRILVHSGFFCVQNLGDQNDAEEGYTLTEASRLLLKDNPLSVAPLLLSMLDPTLTQPWHQLSTWFPNNEPTAFETVHGMSFWEYGTNEPKLGKFFNDAMASDSRLVTSVVIQRCKGVFEDLDSLVDVGGGIGTVAKAIAEAFPHMEWTVFDLPHVVENLQGTKNLKYIGGDMFEAVPSGDAVLLKWILHDWNDEDCVKILQRCKEAITKNGKKGKLIIIDMMVENHKGDDESNETQLFFDMLMMTLVTGRERSEKEWAQIFSEAGFKTYTRYSMLGLRSMIEVYP